MNCFVIMPFAKAFNDVYATIKASVEKATVRYSGRCSRLDDHPVAGRITDRLLEEIKSASLCVADLTGAIPNVMWEVGYAMALGRPTIIVTQEKLSELPFDLKDMQALQYDRSCLKDTLGPGLEKMVIHTLAAHEFPKGEEKADKELMGQMLREQAEVKAMLAQVVSAWAATAPTNAPSPESRIILGNLEGAWFSEESTSNVYAKVIDGALIAPYCYDGDDKLTGVYYDWKKVGNYWFARYKWIDEPISGFAFLKDESADLLTGAWWYASENKMAPDMPPKRGGNAATWYRLPNKKVPKWADAFIARVSKRGFANAMQELTRSASTRTSRRL